MPRLPAKNSREPQDVLNSRETHRQNEDKGLSNLEGKSSEDASSAEPKYVVGNQIAQRRDALGIKQRELAEMVGVSEPTVANWEKGRVDIKWLERAQKLCISLGATSISELVPEAKPLVPKGERRNKMKSMFEAWSLEKQSGESIADVQTSSAYSHPGSIIAERRKSLNMTQRDLADKVGVSEGTVAGWETNAIKMQWLERASRLCQVLQVGLEELVPFATPEPTAQELRDFEKAIKEGNVAKVEQYRHYWS